MWGLVQSTLVMTPFKVTSCLLSYSAAKEWCAQTGAAAASTAANAKTATSPDLIEYSPTGFAGAQHASGMISNSLGREPAAAAKTSNRFGWAGTQYIRDKVLEISMTKATQALHNLGQSIWLDNITRELLDSGTLKRYINELSVTGLTSNPTIFDQAVKNSTAYDAAIGGLVLKGKSAESLFFDLAIEDLSHAAQLFRPVHNLTDGVDGWVSLEVSPLLAYDTASTLAE